MADIRYLSLCSYCFPYQVFLLQVYLATFFRSSQDSPSLKCTYKSQVIHRLFIGYFQVIQQTSIQKYPKSSLAFTLYTLHLTQEKSHQNTIFLAHPQILQYLCTANQFADIKKSVYQRLFWYSETWKISTYPKQEGSKRPLGYDYPAHRASFVGLLCLVAFSYSAWAFVAYSYRKGTPGPQSRE